MTDERFDDLTRRLETATSRRGVLKGAAAVALGGLAARLRGSGSAEARARIRMACARQGQVCSTANDAPGNQRCCPHLECDAADDETPGICVPAGQVCAPGEAGESCANLFESSCGADDHCAQVVNVDGGCACIERICIERLVQQVQQECATGTDCQSGLCVSVPGCCGPSVGNFCAIPCGGAAVTATATTRSRGMGSWQH
jgi:hypothetical protein